MPTSSRRLLGCALSSIDLVVNEVLAAKSATVPALIASTVAATAPKSCSISQRLKAA